MDTFYDELEKYDWKKITEKIYSATDSDVLNAIVKVKPDLDDFVALISPAAEKYVKLMAEKNYAITRRRFGNTIQLYVPLYLSNYCSNQCVYCGFNCRNRIKRSILNETEIRREAEALKTKYKFEHILLVTGEAPAKSSVEYMGRAIEIMKDYFSQVSLEVQPLEIDEYKYLIDKGLFAVYIYQETYNRDRYPLYHPKGRKSDFKYRLETPDRLGKAGIFKTGLGNLIGLEEWRTESFFTALHLRYLENKYWKTKYSIAFPRLRPFVNEGDFDPDFPATEKNLFHLICAYRLFSEDVELSVSTRESSIYRDKIMPFGITTMSAGSKTMPGGYADDNGALEQFSVNDDRSPYEVEAAIKNKGFEAVWKDWDTFLQ